MEARGADPPSAALSPPGLGEALLVIDIINAEGLIILRTVWSTSPDRHRGRRLMPHETISGGRAALMARLDELTSAMLLLPLAAGVQEGSAATAPRPGSSTRRRRRRPAGRMTRAAEPQPRRDWSGKAGAEQRAADIRRFWAGFGRKEHAEGRLAARLAGDVVIG